MKWIINDEEFTNARQAADAIMDSVRNDEYYDNMLDDIYDDIEICGCSYAASVALYRVDEIAYNCGRSDWVDSEASNIEDQLENMDDGDELEFYDCTVIAVEGE